MPEIRGNKGQCMSEHQDFKKAKENTAMLLDLSHMTRGEHIREIWG
jgi:hypothetical protein